MNRREYKAARELIRANGRYALRWLEPKAAKEMGALLDVQKQLDQLAERVWWYRQTPAKGQSLLNRYRTTLIV